MKKNNTKVLTYVILFIGMLVLNYPGLSGLYNRLHESQVISEYDEALAQKSAAGLAAERRAAEAYNERLRALGANGIQDAFSGPEAPLDSEYEQLLNLAGDGVMGAVEIPGISVYLPICHGTSAEVLERAAGHLMGTSLPVGGAGTHSVISAHRGMPSAVLFTDADQIRPGDRFFIHVLGETLAYQVDQIEVMLPEEVSQIEITEGADYVTLLTCTPYGINSHRLLIRGTRTAYVPEAETRANKLTQSIVDWLLQQKVLLASAIMLLLFLVIQVIRLLIRRGKNYRRNGNEKKKVE